MRSSFNYGMLNAKENWSWVLYRMSDGTRYGGEVSQCGRHGYEQLWFDFESAVFVWILVSMVPMIYVLIFLSSGVSNRLYHLLKILKSVFKKERTESICCCFFHYCPNRPGQHVGDRIRFRAPVRTHRNVGAAWCHVWEAVFLQTFMRHHSHCWIFLCARHC